MSVDIQDVITCATFCHDRLRGSGVTRGRISRFPIDLRRRPYNTLTLPCECVIQLCYHSVARECVHCCKGGAASQWEMAILSVSELGNRWTGWLKLWQMWLGPTSMSWPRMPNFKKSAAQGLAGNMVKCTPRVLFIFLQEISRAPLQKILNNFKYLMA